MPYSLTCPTASCALQPCALQPHVPYSLTCPTASCALQLHVPYSPTASRALQPCVPYSLMCPTALCPTALLPHVPYSLVCLTTLQPHVPYSLVCLTTSCALQLHVPYNLMCPTASLKKSTLSPGRLEPDLFIKRIYMLSLPIRLLGGNHHEWPAYSLSAVTCYHVISSCGQYEPPSQLAPVSSEGFQSLCFNGCMGHLKRIGLGTRQCTGRDFASWLVNTTDHIHNLPPVTSKVHKFAQVRVSENSLWAYL